MPMQHPLTLADQRRTLLMHVLQDAPGQYTWRIFVEEHCGCSDADCTLEATEHYRSEAEAEAACWAVGNQMLSGPRNAGQAGEARAT